MTKLPLQNTLLLSSMLLLLAACARTTDPLADTDNWTFVNYWANWCKPCIKEIPELNSLHGRDGFTVAGVNFDGATGDDLATQIETLGVAFPTLDADPAARLGTARPQVLPTTLVLAPGGGLHAVLVGPQTEESLIAATQAETPDSSAEAASGHQ